MIKEKCFWKCAKAGPVIDGVINSYGKQVNFVKYNIATDEGFALGKKYQISGIPYVVVNKNTRIEYKDYNGHLPKLDTLLRESIDKALAGTDVTKETPTPEIAHEDRFDIIKWFFSILDKILGPT